MMLGMSLPERNIEMTIHKKPATIRKVEVDDPAFTLAGGW
jgi:hypothetical protein